MPGLLVGLNCPVRTVVLLSLMKEICSGGVMKSEWWKNNWELWIVPVVLMSTLIFIQTLHTYQHQYGTAHGQCDKNN